MTKRVILLTDGAKVTAALAEILHEAKVIADIRDKRQHQHNNAHDEVGSAAPPLAVLYEVTAQTTSMQIHGVMTLAANVWPGTPLVACRYHRLSRGCR